MIAHRTQTEPFNILLVDDSPIQVRMAQTALRLSGAPSRLHVASDGEAALAFLRRRSPHFDVPTPDLVLLDLHMPKMSGFEVLGEMKEDEDLREIPVLLMTTSDDSRDVLYAYRHHANSFVSKPWDLDEFVEVFQSIHRFWFGVAVLPSRC